MDTGEFKTLDPASNPAQQTSPAALFMAFRDNKPVGRLAAIASGTENVVEGRFGWYDVIDELEVSRQLFDTAKAWLREKGATEISGPLGFTNLDRAGLLTFGYEEIHTFAERKRRQAEPLVLS